MTHVPKKIKKFYDLENSYVITCILSKNIGPLINARFKPRSLLDTNLILINWVNFY